MKITVVTITVNPDAELATTLESIERQRGVEVESIVVDGCRRSEEFKSRFPSSRFFSHPQNGVYEAINFGMSHASGELVGLLHGGDSYPEDDILLKVARAFEDEPSLDFTYGDIRYVKGPERTPGRVYPGGRLERGQLVCGIIPPHPSLYLRREAAQGLGKYREDLTICSDFDMWIRLALSGLKGRRLPIIVADMSSGGISTKLRNRLITNNYEKLKVLKSHNLPANPIRLLGRYFSLIQQLIWNKNRN